MDDHDVQLVQRDLVKRFKALRPSAAPFEWPSPPLNVLDCVLSLNRHYDTFVVPRVGRFATQHPTVKTLAGLRRLINDYQSPLAFSIAELDYRHAERADTILAVTEYLLKAQKSYAERSESARLRQWAISVKPADWRLKRIRGFALSGFQYLRMLFGAQTTKPDIHIRRYVAKVIGRRAVSDVEALALLENAAGRLKLPLRTMEYEIWSESARRKKGREN